MAKSKVGQRVYSSTYGEGIIVEMTSSRDAIVDFNAKGRLEYELKDLAFMDESRSACTHLEAENER